MSSSRRGLLLGLVSAGMLGGCGDLPQPFRGQPGQVASRLARPPAYRIAVPAPDEALLPDADATRFARLLAEALLAQDVPAIHGEPQPLDWLVVPIAERQGGQVLVRYALRDTDGRVLGGLGARPVAVQEWASGQEEVLRRVATEIAPALTTVIARVDAERRTGDENATGAAPPVVLLRPVRGAPGDGNRSLTARMAERLAAQGLRVQDVAEGAQFAVTADVSVVPAGRGLQRVEILWIVSRRDGYELGRVLQLNEVPAGTLNGLWGDIAFVVADEAAGGVRDVIGNAGGMPQPPESPPAPAAAAPAATAPAAAAGATTAAAATTTAPRRRPAPARTTPARARQ